ADQGRRLGADGPRAQRRAPAAVDRPDPAGVPAVPARPGLAARVHRLAGRRRRAGRAVRPGRRPAVLDGADARRLPRPRPAAVPGPAADDPRAGRRELRPARHPPPSPLPPVAVPWPPALTGRATGACGSGSGPSAAGRRWRVLPCEEAGAYPGRDGALGPQCWPVTMGGTVARVTGRGGSARRLLQLGPAAATAPAGTVPVGTSRPARYRA